MTELLNFELHNSRKLSSSNICGFYFNFIAYECFLQLNFLDIDVLCKTIFEESIDPNNLSMAGSTTHIPSEAATRGILRPTTLLQKDSNTGFFL